MCPTIPCKSRWSSCRPASCWRAPLPPSSCPAVTKNACLPCLPHRACGPARSAPCWVCPIRSNCNKRSAMSGNTCSRLLNWTSSPAPAMTRLNCCPAPCCWNGNYTPTLRCARSPLQPTRAPCAACPNNPNPRRCPAPAACRCIPFLPAATTTCALARIASLRSACWACAKCASWMRSWISATWATGCTARCIYSTKSWRKPCPTPLRYPHSLFWRNSWTPAPSKRKKNWGWAQPNCCPSAACGRTCATATYDGCCKTLSKPTPSLLRVKRAANANWPNC